MRRLNFQMRGSTLSDLLKKVFAYGTLRPGYFSHSYLVSELLSLATSFTPATLQGATMYVTPKSSFPLAVPDESGIICGELIDFEDVDDDTWSHHVLKQMDSYEKANKQSGQIFTRQLVTVDLDDSQGKVDAWVYFYNVPLKDHCVESPNSDWLELIGHPSQPNEVNLEWSSHYIGSSDTIDLDDSF